VHDGSCIEFVEGLAKVRASKSVVNLLSSFSSRVCIVLSMDAGYLRIGEFSQRVGVSPERLRAWEKRYGLLAPERSSGGFRLYSDADVARVERMLSHLEGGASAAEAARLAWEAPVVAEPRVGGPVRLDEEVARLRARLDAFDDAGAHAVLDELLATFALETVLRDVVLPYLRDVGVRWRSGDVTIGQEHFASNLLRARLLSLAQGWGQGAGPRVVLAAPPGEQHDLGLIVCGLALSRQGLRVVFVGADSPIDTLITTVHTVRPAMVLLTAMNPAAFDAVRDALRALGAEVPLYLGAAGASPQLADDLGATYVDGDPVSVAFELASQAAARQKGASSARATKRSSGSASADQPTKRSRKSSAVASDSSKT
jgi:DNA-binding transcriptional MerR regulator/methylmalonyl-CoA mutase cobalamin-binding subunit